MSSTFELLAVLVGTITPGSLQTKKKKTKQNEKQKQKTHTCDFLNALCFPEFVIPRSLSTLYRCSLTKMAQGIPFHEIPLIRNCCNHMGNCTLVGSYLTIAARISSWSFIQVSTRQLAVSSLSKGISSIHNFHKSIGTDRTWNHNLSHCKWALYRLS